ncbi:MAG: class I SAM-dependent methyltransferase [Deltaproteobacteria bacterium]|nr:class I SAM-dependent methyltransferase [Deltaproteobacteria bacterium]
MSSETNDYRKYFIVDGRHVGDYEGMYQNCPDPWRIEELGFRLDMRAALALVDLLPAKPLRVLDVGCGAGFLTEKLAGLLSATRPGSTLTGTDVSPKAAQLAAARFEARAGGFPGVKAGFVAFDFRRLGGPGTPWADGSLDLVFMSQVVWGLAGSLGDVFRGARQVLSPEGSLVLSQHFPPEGEQAHAPEVRPETLAVMIGEAGFALEHTLETDREANRHWAGLWSCV